MSLKMRFTENELAMTKGLADVFIEILTTKHNYTYFKEFEQKAYSFIVNTVWGYKKKLRGEELTEEKFQSLVQSIFYMLLTSPTFLKSFDDFKPDYDINDLTIDDIEIIENEQMQPVNKSKYIN